MLNSNEAVSRHSVYILQDYFEIVRHPMDLSTIKRKLDAGQYNNPWEVCMAVVPNITQFCF